MSRRKDFAVFEIFELECILLGVKQGVVRSGALLIGRVRIGDAVGECAQTVLTVLAVLTVLTVLTVIVVATRARVDVGAGCETGDAFLGCTLGVFLLVETLTRLCDFRGVARGRHVCVRISVLLLRGWVFFLLDERGESIQSFDDALKESLLFVGFFALGVFVSTKGLHQDLYNSVAFHLGNVGKEFADDETRTREKGDVVRKRIRVI